jgi:hypothetical protein
MTKRPASPPNRSKVQRVSVTFPANHYTELVRISERKRVSVAWVVRDAVDAYLSADAPLLHPRS